MSTTQRRDLAIMSILKKYANHEYRSVGAGCNHKTYILENHFSKIITDINNIESEAGAELDKLKKQNENLERWNKQNQTAWGKQVQEWESTIKRLETKNSEMLQSLHGFLQNAVSNRKAASNQIEYYRAYFNTVIKKLDGREDTP